TGRGALAVRCRAATRPQLGKATEVAIEGPHVPRAVLETDGGDLCIEGEVGTRVGSPHTTREQLQEARARRQQPGGRAVQRRGEEGQRPVELRGWGEYLRMGH